MLRLLKSNVAFALILCFQFGSMRSVYSQIDHWETVVYEYDSWNYLIPTGPVDSDWNTLAFDAGSWLIGAGGFGYGDGDDNTLLPGGTVSVFQRIEFEIIDTAAINAAALVVDFDDSFVAYLNGVEIQRELLTSPGQPAWDQLADGLHEAQFYSGAYAAQYTITKSFLREHMLEGTNVLCVQTHNESISSSDLSSRVYLHLGINNTSSEYGAAPAWFVPPVILETSNLPIVIINTTGGADIVDDPKVAAVMGIINNGDEINSVGDPFNEFYGEIGIEIRGSSSGTFPKKAYGLETRGPDSTNYNVSIFDWPIDNDWILYAPYSDKSLIRNVLTYKLGNEMGDYAPRTQMVELIVNDQYVGVYVFMERIKQNPGRVNVNKLNYDETTGNDLTGGYVVKIDKTTGGGIIAWTSPYTAAAPAWGAIRYQLHDPEIDVIHPTQLAYIETYITDFENALNGADYTDPDLGYRAYIDVPSFIDFMLVNEISKNVDGYRISTYLHKHRLSEGGKLHAGPLWDFNLGWGNANYCDGGLTSGWEIYFNSVCGGGGDLNNPFWWNRLVTDPEFNHDLNCRWQTLRMTTLNTDSILNYINEMEIYLEEAAERNFQRWPVLGNYVWPNNYVGDTYAEEMEYLKTWTVARLEWMGENMFGSCEDLGITDSEKSRTVQIYPNPTASITTLFFDETIGSGRVEIVNHLGQIITIINFENKKLIELDLQALSPALYFIKTYDGSTAISTEKIIRK